MNVLHYIIGLGLALLKTVDYSVQSVTNALEQMTVELPEQVCVYKPSKLGNNPMHRRGNTVGKRITLKQRAIHSDLALGESRNVVKGIWMRLYEHIKLDLTIEGMMDRMHERKKFHAAILKHPMN